MESAFGGEKPSENNPIESPPDVGTDSDTEAAKFFMFHINNPCKVEVAPGEVENIRSFWITEARRVLPTMTDETQKILLQECINMYEEK